MILAYKNTAVRLETPKIGDRGIHLFGSQQTTNCVLNDLFELCVMLRHNCGVRRGAGKDSASGGASATGGTSASGGASASGDASASGRARARPVEVEDSGDDGERGGGRR